MSFYFPNVNPTYIHKREGTENDPFIKLIDTNYVRNSFFTLKEIPSFSNEFKVTDSKGAVLTQVESDDPGMNQYRVDYSEGLVQFNQDRTGERVTCEYTGMGYVSIPASRVWIQGEDGDILKSLEEAMADVQDGVETLGQVGALRFTGEYSESASYKKWNFVSYKQKTFVALKDVEGISPDNEEYWGLVSTGTSFSGVHDENKAYNVGDIVSNKDKTNLYLSTKMNNKESLSNTEYWELMISLENAVTDMVNTIDQQILALENLKNSLINKEEELDLGELDRNERVSTAIENIENALEDSETINSLIEQAEEERVSNEEERILQENSRKDSEIIRQSKEDERQSSEISREQRLQMFLSDSQQVIDNAQEALEEIDGMKITVESLVDESASNLIQTAEYVDMLSEWKFVGEYGSEIDYRKYNIVSYNGSSYMANEDVTNLSPDESSEIWGLLSIKGADGTFITIEGNQANEEGDINLNNLGIVRESQLNVVEKDIKDSIGHVSELKTLNKDNLVVAINELKDKIDDIISVM